MTLLSKIDSCAVGNFCLEGNKKVAFIKTKSERRRVTIWIRMGYTELNTLSSQHINTKLIL